MTEKKITEERLCVVERSVFIASDGTEFATAAGCFSHEFNLAEKVVNSLPHFDFTPYCCAVDVTWEWYYVTCQEDVDTIRAVRYNTDSGDYVASDPVFPCWLACSVDDDGYGSIEGTPEQVFRAMDAFKEELLDLVGKNGRKEEQSV